MARRLRATVGRATLLGLATANRNIAAALVIAASIGGDAIVYTLVGALAIPVVLIVLAGQVGRRTGATAGSGSRHPPRGKRGPSPRRSIMPA